MLRDNVTLSHDGVQCVGDGQGHHGCCLAHNSLFHRRALVSGRHRGCLADSSLHDWRLAGQLLGDAGSRGG
jgi:hypothetical protein